MHHRRDVLARCNEWTSSGKLSKLYLWHRSWARSPPDGSETLLSCRTSLWAHAPFPRDEWRSAQRRKSSHSAPTASPSCSPVKGAMLPKVKNLVTIIQHQCHIRLHPSETTEQMHFYPPGNPGLWQTMWLDVNTVSHFKPHVVVAQLFIVLIVGLGSAHLRRDILSLLNE